MEGSATPNPTENEWERETGERNSENWGGTMGIYGQVNQALKTAMKNKDKPRLLALRGIRAAFIEKQKQDNTQKY